MFFSHFPTLFTFLLCFLILRSSNFRVLSFFMSSTLCLLLFSFVASAPVWETPPLRAPKNELPQKKQNQTRGCSFSGTIFTLPCSNLKKFLGCILHVFTFFFESFDVFFVFSCFPFSVPFLLTSSLLPCKIRSLRENCWWWLWMKWSRTCWPCTDQIWRRTAANAQREIRNVVTLCAETLMDPLSQPTRCFVHRKCFTWPAVTFLKTDRHGQQGLWMFCLLDGSDYNMFYVAGRVSDVWKTLCLFCCHNK